MPYANTVVIAGDDVEVIDFAELLTMVDLEFLGVLPVGVAGGFLDVYGGLLAGHGQTVLLADGADSMVLCWRRTGEGATVINLRAFVCMRLFGGPGP